MVQVYKQPYQAPPKRVNDREMWDSLPDDHKAFIRAMREPGIPLADGLKIESITYKGKKWERL